MDENKLNDINDCKNVNTKGNIILDENCGSEGISEDATALIPTDENEAAIRETEAQLNAKRAELSALEEEIQRAEAMSAARRSMVAEGCEEAVIALAMWDKKPETSIFDAVEHTVERYPQFRSTRPCITFGAQTKGDCSDDSNTLRQAFGLA